MWPRTAHMIRALIMWSLRSRELATVHSECFCFKKKIADGRHHGLEPDSWLQSQTAVVAHTLDLLKINQPSSAGDTHNDSTPSVKTTRQFKTYGPQACRCFMIRHLLYIWPFQGVSVACGPLSDTWWGLTQMAPPTMSKQICLWGKFSSAVWD